MRVKLSICIAAAAVMLCGCAASPQMLAAQKAFRESIPVCNGVSDCQVKWEAAQLWVVQNAGVKVQTATSVVIETYNSPESSTRLAVRVTKEPLGGGRYRIVALAGCANIFGCQPNHLAAALDFNRQVSAAVP